MLESDNLKYWQIDDLPKTESPYIIIDPTLSKNKVAVLNKVLPDVGLYYAVKSLNDKNIIEAIDDFVTGYDVASYGEINNLVNLGISPSRIIFSNPVKIPSHIKKAFEVGINYFAFDSISEIKKLSKLAPGSNVYLRIKVTDHGSSFPLSQKFGVDVNSAVAYCSTAIEFGLNVIGLSFHVGSQSENIQAWTQAIEVAGATIKRLNKVGINISILDIGGGFPAYYGQPTITIETLADSIIKSINMNIPKHIKIIAEPGRFISANSAVIVTSVIGAENRSGVAWLYLDVGTFSGLIEPLEMNNWKYPIKNFDKSNQAHDKSYILTGPTCDACDTLGENYMLPSNTELGDRIIIGSTGAYTVVYESYFNGFEPMKRFYIN